MSSRIWKEISGLFLPNLCLLCDSRLDHDGQYLCDKCWRTLPPYPERSGSPLRSLRGVLDNLWIGWEYDERLRRIIHLFKYHGRPELASRLVREWCEVMRDSAAVSDFDVLLPVPIHSARRRSRGFNQSECLAASLAANYKLQLEQAGTVRIVNTPSQTTLGRQKRWRSVEHAFELGDTQAARDKRILIVDDLVTSGATLHALASLLRRNGAAGVSAAVLTAPSAEGQAI
jgi:ComF family protein